MGEGQTGGHVAAIIADIRQERERQDRKWGEQNHDNYVWNAILVEEIGEVAHAMLTEEPRDELRQELVQAAAVIVAWLECLERNP